MKLRMFLAILCLIATSPYRADAQQDRPPDSTVSEFQKDFAAAYHRRDVDAMAGAFTEAAIRVTPSGIFEGRDAIRRGFQDALKVGLHDYSVRRVHSRSEGRFVFNVGEWQATVGDQPLRGYYTAILVTEGGQTKIMEETVTIASPR
ncbi:nuclear transport factor 2 family protein [Bradyrhizobium sp. RT9a]|uniref:YybH family protein n=1 Tax=Bradyrhizobium sp. RT9a TaxID=3156384 RepID=UPI0033925B92